MNTNAPLRGRIALVTGASRGIGLGIAHELGLAGATVYVTGRTRAGESREGLPGTIDDAARLVTESGGEGIAVACDHTDDRAIDALAETVQARHGKLHLLVNNAWGGYEDYDAKLFTMDPADQPLWRFDRMLATGVRSQYATTRALIPLLARGEKSLVVHVSAGDDGKYLGDVQYDVAKAAVDRLAFAFTKALRGKGIGALALHPGLSRTERVVAVTGTDQIEGSHSARYVGRAVVALAGDPHVAARAGRAWKTAVLGEEYGFTDVDGTRPRPFVLPEF
jgi:NAD(P)-dependent dehydrogenase (short-subunit alcohol dehydrogenase family)